MTNKRTKSKATSEYIAHRRESDQAIQSVAEHLKAVAAISARNASKFKVQARSTELCEDLSGVGEILGLVHDLGKYSKEFQDYIKSATGEIDQDADDYVDSDSLRGKVDHSTAGAQLLWSELSALPAEQLYAAEILALCVASHHSGLIDLISPDGQDIFSKRMLKKETRAHLAETKGKLDPALAKRVAELLGESNTAQTLTRFIRGIVELEHKNGRSNTVLNFKIGLLARMLFSCLIDADRSDTADFEKPRRTRARQSSMFPNWRVLCDRLEQHLAGLPSTKPIDNIRHEVSEHCRNAAEMRQQIYSLTVPTGGGKTLASLRFALNHARMHSLDRVIYVVPYTSIIDQNADVVRSILEPSDEGVVPGSVVLEHHSNLTPEEQTWRSKILAENWDAPIVFTTSVQLLEALFGAGTRGARRAHQLASSVIIFDEAQTVPVRCVHMFNNAVNFLAEHCGSTVLLCTATQPLLNGVNEQNGAARFGGNDEIMPNVSALFGSLKRVEVVSKIRSEGWSDSDIRRLAEGAVEETTSCLVIVNTKRAARAVYDFGSLSGDAKKYHLSTAMCPAHRRNIFAEIRSRLLSGEPTLCVSTQLIEAGVDIDFGTVVRCLAGLDSIAQAAGRCNRSGLWPLAHVYLVNPAEDKADSLVDIQFGKQVTERILREFERDPAAFEHSLLSPSAVKKYFEYYFYQRADTMCYPTAASETQRDDSLLRMLSCNKMAVEEFELNHKVRPSIPLVQSFMSANKAFKAIDTATRGIVVPYGTDGKKLVADLCAAFVPAQQMKLIHSAQQYSVNVYPNVFENLLRSAAISEVGSATGIYHLHPRYYSEEFGLTETPCNLLEDLYA